MIVLLVVANATWSGLCVLTAAVLTGTASMFGLTHVVGEGVFVGGLAGLEWSQREQLRRSRGPRSPICTTLLARPPWIRPHWSSCGRQLKACLMHCLMTKP